MANVASSNYTATNTRFSIPGDDGDRFNRILHVYSLATALEEHDHSDGRGLPVSTDQLLTITSTDTGASSQVTIFQGDSASPADNDEVYISYKTSNDAGEQTELGRFTWVATDVSDGTEDGRLDFAVMTAGTLADELQLDGAALSPSTSDGLAIGTSSLMFSDLFLASGSVINFNNGDITLTHSSNTLTFAGGTLAVPTILATDIKIGEDDETKIDFETADEIHFYVANASEITLAANLFRPTTSDGIALGSGSYMWSDLFLASGSVINFNNGDVTLTQDLELQHDGATISLGTNDDVVITHVADDGLIIRNMVGGFTKLAIHASDTDVADGNLLGEISFVAPVEGAGSDAILPAAAIAARSEGDFSATNNATELVFNTGASEDASIGATGGKMILSSAGNLNLTAGGLQFPATFSNETNANTLDDYEEGTFTPTLDSYGYTPDRIEGRYTKIGRMVFAIVVFDPSGTSADYSEFLLEALPFVAIDDNAPGIVTFGTSQSYDYDNDYNPQYFFNLKNTVQVKGWDVSGGVIEYVGRAREISRGNEIILGIQYETAS